MQLAQPETMHAQLKLQTQDVHEALHHHPKIGRLMADDLTEAEYYGLLLSYARYYRSAEAYRKDIGAWPALSLANAVTHFDQDLSNQPKFSKREIANIDWQPDALSCLGVLYVLHGASLGGRMIAKHLNKTSPTLPTTFFQLGVGPAQWQTLLNTVASQLQQEEQLAVVIASARRTFVEFGEWVQQTA